MKLDTPPPNAGHKQDHTRAPGELETLIRARYPIIYVVTWEEQRVEDHVAIIAASRGKDLFTWTLTSGLQARGAKSAARKGQIADPVEALDTVIENKQPAIYLFKDLHRFTSGASTNAAVVRKLREVSHALTDSYKSLIITAPVVDMSADLEKDITVLDYPLPGADDFAILLERIARDVAESADLDLNIDDNSREKLVQAAMGLTLQEAENVFAKTIVNDGTLDADDVSVVFSEKRQIIRKNGLLEYCEAETSLG